MWLWSSGRNLGQNAWHDAWQRITVNAYLLGEMTDSWRGKEREGASEHRELFIIRVLVREGNGTPLQYSCLENPMDRGAGWAAVHGVTKSQT